MKIGILSDCHGNIQGLKRAYDVLKTAGAEKFYCLGDVVGYGASSPQCIDFLRSSFSLTLAGNHDHAFLEKTPITHYQEYAIEALFLARSQLNPDQRDFLKNLPMEHIQELQDQVLYFTHAHPKGYEEWMYFPEDPYFDLFQEKQINKSNGKPDSRVALCFYGHTHQAQFYRSTGDCEIQNPENFTQYSYAEEEGQTLVINVGSCGQPRDGDTRVSCLLLDTASKCFTFLRGEYNIEGSQAQMRQSGLSEFLVERLNFGR